MKNFTPFSLKSLHFNKIDETTFYWTKYSAVKNGDTPKY